MVDRVEMPVESVLTGSTATTQLVEIRMCGPLTVRRQGMSITLPTSRKVRGLVAYLALAPHAVNRSQLCELLWDVPNDPRGELRWCLSKIRALIDVPERRRVDTRADTVSLDLADCFVDAIEIVRQAQSIRSMTTQRPRALLDLFAGDFLEGLEIDRSPVFSTWVTAQRRQFRGYHAALLEHLVTTAPDDAVSDYLEKWLELAPFDTKVHALMLNMLVRHGQIREGEEHLSATIRSFESESLDCAPLHEAWRSARAESDSVLLARTVMPSVVRPNVVRPNVVRPNVVRPGGIERGEGVAIAPRRASIAVMPFIDRSVVPGARGGAADALAYDVIARLAKLRSLFVIAQGSVFALHEQRIGPQEAGRMLNVDYVVNGSVQRNGQRLIVTVELAERRTGQVVWAEIFNHKADNAFVVLDEIGNRIVASIANEIETVERNRAVLQPPNSLDAWQAYHRGLWHMYRFTQADNEQARHFFAVAVRLDPTFARAYAGLSFTHFQNAFQNWGRRVLEIDRAFEIAGHSLMADDRDPAAHWAMGRALWLRGQHGQSLVELERAVHLSPNFALGHYTLAFVHAQAGNPETAISSADRSRDLSPFDPLLFAMLGARAMAMVRIGQFEASADYAVQAAARPNAHAHVQAIAAFSLALAGRLNEGRACMASIHKALPHYRFEDFRNAMHLAPEGEQLFREGARRIGVT